MTARPTARRPPSRPALALAGAAIVAVGLWLAGDRPGLEASYHANDAFWRSDPVASETAAPQVDGPAGLRRVLAAQEISSLTWRGWLEVDHAGRHGFEIRASGAARLRVGDSAVVALEDERGKQRAQGEVVLARGLHPIEIASAHSRGAPSLETWWSPPGAAARPLDVDRLYARRPGPLRRWSRRAAAGIAPLGRRALGAGLAVVGLCLVAAAIRAARPRFGRLDAGPAGRGGRVDLVVLALLAVSAYAVLWRAAGSPLGSVDAYWLYQAVHAPAADGAAESLPHLVVLRAFVGLHDGDPFAAARSASACLLTLALVALVIGAVGFAPAARGSMAAAAGLVLVAQPFLFLDTGAVLPELSAMAWVTLGLAICVHQSTTGKRRRLTSAVALGALTLLAVRSHPGGLVLLWPALLLLRSDGEWAPRRAGGRLAAWGSGLVIAQLAIWAAAAVTGGRGPGSGTASIEGLAAASAWRWPQVLWPPDAAAGPGADLRALALLVVGAALAATLGGQPLERRLLHLTPLVYVATLLVLRLFAPAATQPTDLLPILPAACLLGAPLFLYAGLDRLTWRRALTWPFLIPLAAVAAELVVVAPYLSGRLAAEEIVPGMTPLAAGDFVRRTLGPTFAVAAVIAAALSLAARRLRLPVLLAAAVLALGPGIATTTRVLASRQPAQRADLALYPWRQLGDDMRTARRHRIAVSPALVHGSAMFGPPPALEVIGRLFFRQADLEIGTDTRARKRAHYLIVGPDEVRRRIARTPAVGRRIERDEAGRLALLRRLEKKPAARDRDRQRRLRETSDEAGEGPATIAPEQ